MSSEDKIDFIDFTSSDGSEKIGTKYPTFGGPHPKKNQQRMKI
jgi:hypothetical protein